MNKSNKIRFFRSDHGGSYMSNLDDMTTEEYSNYSISGLDIKKKKSTSNFTQFKKEYNRKEEQKH